MKTTDARKLVLIVVSWLARLLAVLVFLLLGGFFVEHWQEWFIEPFPRTPPLSVWIGQALHLLILAGLIVVLRWPRVGSVLVIGAAFAFFFPRAGSRFPWHFGATALPALLLLFCWWQLRRLAARPSRQPDSR